jgi:MOSC domain-containing protein YiiM
MAQLLSVNVGLPREIEWRGKTVHTAVWKEPVRGRRKVGKLNIDGEGQGDLQGHGGWQRGGFCLPGPVLSLLGKAARAKGLCI